MKSTKIQTQTCTKRRTYSETLQTRTHYVLNIQWYKSNQNVIS